MNVLRRSTRISYRLCLYFEQNYSVNTVISIKVAGSLNSLSHVQQRKISSSSITDSLIKAQNNLFMALSESTPVYYCQNLLLQIHDKTGFPWWLTIISTTILLRTIVTVPFAIYQSYILAKLDGVKKEMGVIAKELQKETSMAVQLYKWDEKTAKLVFRRSIKKQWDNLIIRENCHPFKSALLIFFQIPLWVSLSISLRNLVYMLPHQDLHAQLTVQEMSVGGFGWIPNLIEVDASLILPVTACLLNLSIIELQILTKRNNPTNFQKYMTNIFRGLCLIMVPIGSQIPSCIVLFWTASSSFGLIQNLVLLSPGVKRLCRIPQTTSELNRPYQHILLQIEKRFNTFKRKLG